MGHYTPSDEYLAGLFDGEGCIVISKRHYRLKSGEKAPWYTLVVCVVNTHLPTILMLRDEFVSKSAYVFRMDKINAKPKGKAQRPCWKWHVASDIAETFLKRVLPHLVIKKEEAYLALQFRDHVRKYKHAHLSFVNCRDEWMTSELYLKIHEEREAMYWKMRALKRPDFSDYDGIAVNSGKIPCPAFSESAEGQSRAKLGHIDLGVCNERTLRAKAKGRSELHGNMQSAAETTAPYKATVVYEPTKVVNFRERVL